MSEGDNTDAVIHSVIFHENVWVNELGEHLPDAGMEQALEYEAIYCESYAEVYSIEQLVEQWNGASYTGIRAWLDNFERALDEGAPLAYYSDRPTEISRRYRVSSA